MLRSIGKLALLAGMVSLGLTTAVAEDDVRLRLNWMYYGSHAGFALGKDHGHYDDDGIGIDIRSGSSSCSAHRLVANSDSDFAYGSCGAPINLTSQGAEVIAVAVIDVTLGLPFSGANTDKQLGLNVASV